MFLWSFPFVIFLQLCGAFDILVVFPFPRKSHSILGDGMVKHLLDAGHNVTYITPYARENPRSNLHQIDVSENIKIIEIASDGLLNTENLMSKATKSQFAMINMMLKIVNATLTNRNVKKLLDDPNNRFDAVIAEWMYSEMYSGFSLVFGCPLIWTTPMDPYAVMFSLVDVAPSPAYTANHMIAQHPPFTFYQRVKQLWKMVERELVLWSLDPRRRSIYDNAFEPVLSKRGIKYVPLNEIMYNASLTLGNTDSSFDQALNLPQNYKHILGYHIPKEATPLPKDIKKIMDEATYGVIYFSMGSILKSKSILAPVKRELLELFRRLPQTVIWKFEEELPFLPENVHIVQWAPQTGVLDHPNCILFITHGGLLSIAEAIHYAVPIIGVPAFADQFINIDKAVRKGFARKVDLDLNIAKNMKDAIEDVLGNSSYREKIREASWIYHHRLASPGVELVHWVEHVIKTRGALHLRSPAFLMPFYQIYYIDLAAAIIMTFFCLYLAIKFVNADRYSYLSYRCTTNLNIKKKQA